MTTDIKELVKRLRDAGVVTKGVFIGHIHDAADALEAMAGEAVLLRRALGQRQEQLEVATAERDRLKAALEEIAIKAGLSECGGDYVAAVTVIGDIEQMADKALGGDAS